jgi:hypothetical protein
VAGPGKMGLWVSGLIVALVAAGGILLFPKRPRRKTSTAASESALLEYLKEFHLLRRPGL